jgi:tetratricopeptide (TPR) repeat protein
MFNRGCDRDTDRAISTVAEAFLDVLFHRMGVEELDQVNSISDMEDELKKSPGDIHIMYKIATMYRAQGDDDEALRTYEKVLTADPGNDYGYQVDALFWQASLEAALSQRPDNLVSFITEHKSHPNIQFAYRNLADTYTKRNEMHKAIAVFKEGAGLFQEDASFLNSVAWWIYENKVGSEYATAVTYAEEAVALQPEDCALWDTLAQLLNVTGQKQKATEASEHALSLAPENRREEYQRYLDKIREGN